MSDDASIIDLGDVPLLSGEVLRNARLSYKTYGQLSDTGDNVVVLPTFYTGTHHRSEGFFGPGHAIDPAWHFIVCPNMFGNGLSSSPGHSAAPQNGARFPLVTLWDNIACQHRLNSDHLRAKRIALVAGWSMAGCQAYQWAAQYPDMVQAILRFCASARTSPHNFVFLEGVRAALCADQAWNGGNYTTPPVAGLRAFARVYAGWAFSQTFYRDGLYRQLSSAQLSSAQLSSARLGFAVPEALLQDWQADHVRDWDANNLLAKLETWQAADISAGPVYQGDFRAALGRFAHARS